jgi:molybdopterin adenylyltransferase
MDPQTLLFYSSSEWFKTFSSKQGAGSRTKKGSRWLWIEKHLRACHHANPSCESKLRSAMPKLGDPISEHKGKAASASARVAVVTLSSTRSLDDDQSGDIIERILLENGHSVALRKLVADNRNVLRATLREIVRQKDVHAIVTSGGTGLTSSDITIETVRGMLDKELLGFNSLFMMLSYPQAKSSCMLSQTTAGTIKGKLIFCLPGSPRACKLGMEMLILPELKHMLMLLES